MLSEAEKRYLLKVARNAIESELNNIPPQEMSLCPPSLMKPCGVFVTLSKQGELRGCIGYTEEVRPLAMAVEDVAVKAATEDPRFTEVSPDELPLIEIEISVISPIVPIKNIEELEIGHHGLLLEWKAYRGLLLPQVPLDYGWDTETFLNQTSRKAGLPPSAWKYPETKLYVFTAEVFSERSLEIARQ